MAFHEVAVKKSAEATVALNLRGNRKLLLHVDHKFVLAAGGRPLLSTLESGTRFPGSEELYRLWDGKEF